MQPALNTKPTLSAGCCSGLLWSSSEFFQIQYDLAVLLNYPVIHTYFTVTAVALSRHTTSNSLLALQKKTH